MSDEQGGNTDGRIKDLFMYYMLYLWPTVMQARTCCKTERRGIVGEF